jgi:hypothetical protein
MRVWAAVLLLLVVAGMLVEGSGQKTSSAIASMERKLSSLQSNAGSVHPSPAPTEFTEAEINAYCAAGRLTLPAGVQSVSFQEQPGIVTGTARVDFDRLKSGRDSSNPLLTIFSGVHTVVVAAHAHGTGGDGFVQIDSVLLDGIEIPRFVLQLFVEKYLEPKYPDVGLNSRFPLPDRIDTAIVGLHRVTVAQK